MLAVAKAITGGDAAVRRADFDFKYRATLVDLSGKTLGIVGFGGIGSRVAAMAKAALGMEVIVSSRGADQMELRRLGYRSALLDELLAQADVVSLHFPLLPPGPVLGKRELALMKPTAILVNTARGGLVDEAALAGALCAGALAGAGLDVFGREPMPADHPLLATLNAVLTPHVAGSAREALERTARQLVERLVAVLAGRPMDVVNPAVWERRRRPAGAGVPPLSPG
jgi:D-3-phosphoglycerate dehydrogenase